MVCRHDLERHTRDVETAGDGAHLLVGKLAHAANGLVDGSHDHVLQHLDVLGIERIGVNSEVDEITAKGGQNVVGYLMEKEIAFLGNAVSKHGKVCRVSGKNDPEVRGCGSGGD